MLGKKFDQVVGKRTAAYVLAISTTLGASGCVNMSYTPPQGRQIGQGVGGIVGGIGGAVIGKELSKSGLGTGIGAGIGIYTGRQIGGAIGEAAAANRGHCDSTNRTSIDRRTGQIIVARDDQNCKDRGPHQGYPAGQYPGY